MASSSSSSSLSANNNNNNNVAAVAVDDDNVSSSTVTSDDDVQLLLPLQDGSHNSVHVVIIPSDYGNMTANDRTNFRQRLQYTIDICRKNNKSSLWIDVPMSCASLIEEMTDFGLTFHHARGNVATLNVWLLSETSSNKVPEFATHHVGVGAIVVNSRNEILCVREKRQHNLRRWKLPGGLSELGEDIGDAAVREVLEETGIRCRFQNIVSFRHSHGMAFGRSDLYFVCRLEPLEEEMDGNTVIPKPVPCEEEIEAAAWIPMDDYRTMISSEEKGGGGHPMMEHVMKLYDEDCKIEQTVVPSIVPGRNPSPIYHPPLRQCKNNETNE